MVDAIVMTPGAGGIAPESGTYAFEGVETVGFDGNNYTVTHPDLDVERPRVVEAGADSWVDQRSVDRAAEPAARYRPARREHRRGDIRDVSLRADSGRDRA